MKRNSIILIFPLILIIIVSADMDIYKTSSLNLGTGKVAHIAIVVNDIEATTKAYAELFGMEPPKIKLGTSPPDYMGMPTEGKAKMAFINLDNITLEFFEPVGGPTAWSDFLESHGEGVHHLGFWVEGLDEHVKNLEEKEMSVIQSGGGAWGRYRYIDATADLTVMIELMELSNPE
jgi:methylmalonyl-CoA/ethylmalonyl-CoA epimerase